MTKKTNDFKKRFTNKRGIGILSVTLAISFISLGVISYLATTLFEVANSSGLDKGLQAYYTARVCRDKFDNLQPNPLNFGASCVYGTGINFSDSTNTSITCTNLGSDSTVVTVGDCTCTAQYLGAVTNFYSMTFTGICGSRQDDNDKYSVSINKNIYSCETCAQMCSVPGGIGAPCNTSCTPPVSCGTCCQSGTCNAGTGLCE